MATVESRQVEISFPHFPISQEIIDTALIAQWNDQRYYVEYAGKHPQVALVGERHYNPQFVAKQAELITLIDPGLMLHEFAGGWIYDPKTDKFQRQPGRKIDDELNEMGLDSQQVPRKLIHLARMRKLPIMGCDLTYSEIDEICEAFYEENPDLLHKDGVGLHAQSEEIMPFRDSAMQNILIVATIIARQPTVAIMGTTHARNIHESGFLQKIGLQYVFIDQTASLK